MPAGRAGCSTEQARRAGALGLARRAVALRLDGVPQRTLLGVSSRGGLAEFMTAPAASIYPLPDGVPPEAGSLAEPLAVCVRGARLGGVVSAVNYLGAVTQIAVAVPGGPTVLIQKTSDGRLAGLADGVRVHLGWAPEAAFVLPRDGA